MWLFNTIQIYRLRKIFVKYNDSIFLHSLSLGCNRNQERDEAQFNSKSFNLQRNTLQIILKCQEVQVDDIDSRWKVMCHHLTTIEPLLRGGWGLWYHVRTWRTWGHEICQVKPTSAQSMEEAGQEWGHQGRDVTQGGADWVLLWRPHRGDCVIR